MFQIHLSLQAIADVQNLIQGEAENEMLRNIGLEHLRDTRLCSRNTLMEHYISLGRISLSLSVLQDYLPWESYVRKTMSESVILITSLRFTGNIM